MAGVTDIVGGGVAVPFKLIVSGLLALLSVMATVALRVPNAVGVKVS